LFLYRREHSGISLFDGNRDLLEIGARRIEKRLIGNTALAIEHIQNGSTTKPWLVLRYYIKTICPDHAMHRSAVCEIIVNKICLAEIADKIIDLTITTTYNLQPTT
jgi:hypothetical protein